MVPRFFFTWMRDLQGKQSLKCVGHTLALYKFYLKNTVLQFCLCSNLFANYEIKYTFLSSLPSPPNVVMRHNSLTVFCYVVRRLICAYCLITDCCEYVFQCSLCNLQIIPWADIKKIAYGDMNLERKRYYQ